MDCSADITGLIAGKLYFNMLMVARNTSSNSFRVFFNTSFEKLNPILDQSFSLIRIPSSITHDCESSYQSTT